jgi:ATP-dependent Clp protease ATP-binding subunit ClpA
MNTPRYIDDRRHLPKYVWRLLRFKTVVFETKRISGKHSSKSDQIKLKTSLKINVSQSPGARPMERAIEQLIAQPLARAILEKRINPGRELIARVANGVVTFN